MLTALTTFSGCKSTASANADAAIAALAPPLPAAPVMEPVRFEDREGGLWLSYNDYRALERNVIAMREYAEKLEIVVWFYRGGK